MPGARIYVGDFFYWTSYLAGRDVDKLLDIDVNFLRAVCFVIKYFGTDCPLLLFCTLDDGIWA